MGGGLFARAVGEPELAQFWTRYLDDHHQRLAFVVHHPWWTLLACVAALRLAWISCHVDPAPARARVRGDGSERPGDTDHPARDAVLAVLGMRGLGGLPARWTGLAALRVPADPAAYSHGARRQTLRRKCRAAERQGVTCRLVPRGPERETLLARAHAAERAHPDDWYRNPAPDNSDLLRHDLWLVAEDADGVPLLLTVAPVWGDTAVLRYFRTLGWERVHSDARYLATRALVEELSRRGVRTLLDTEHPGEQSNGIRHFQRMVGFRYHRVRRAPLTAAADPVAA